MFNQKINEVKNELLDIIKNLQVTQSDFIDKNIKKALEMNILLSEAVHECSKVSNQRKRDLSDINTSIFLSLI